MNATSKMICTEPSSFAIQKYAIQNHHSPTVVFLCPIVYPVLRWCLLYKVLSQQGVQNCALRDQYQPQTPHSQTIQHWTCPTGVCHTRDHCHTRRPRHLVDNQSRTPMGSNQFFRRAPYHDMPVCLSSEAHTPSTTVGALGDALFT